MKSFALPLSLLGLILALSLLNGAAIRRDVNDWIVRTERAEQAAASGDWEAAEAGLKDVYADWSNRQTYLHTVAVHEDLDAAESAFLRAISCTQTQGETEFRCETQELLARFRMLAEREQVDIKNIF